MVRRAVGLPGLGGAWLRSGEGATAPLLAARVEVFVDGFETFLIDVGVDLGGGNVGVAEEFLNDPEVGAVL